MATQKTPTPEAEEAPSKTETLSAPSPVPADAPEPVPETGAVAADAGAGVAQQVPTAPAPRRRGGFLPLVLGGVVAAGIGAAGTIYLLPRIPPEWLPVQPQAGADAAALRAALADQATRLDVLGADLAALKAAEPPAPDLSAMESALAGLETRLAALETRPVAQADPAALDDLRRDLDAVRTRLSEIAGAGTLAQDQIAAAAQAAADRITQAEAEAQRLRAEADAAARRAMAQAGLARLVAALDSGLPQGPALADLQAAGVTVPPEVLADVPSLPALREAFPVAARAALSASRRALADGNALDRIGAFLMAQTGARSLAPKEGNDPDAVLSRAEAAVAAGDLAAALGELSALPAEGQAEMAVWIEMAQRSMAAKDALGALSQTLN
ncbi:COG4223 family protein [Pontitalea aquivivens]|uniref:COG4223 family protein n=1 Tax=Pontitalea aquivivens TaxID=3388663 RepID=UPI00397064C4